MDYYDRYSEFREDGDIKFVPFIGIDESSTDKYVKFNKSRMRMDALSYKYYGDANYGWLILQANPKYGSMEFSIPDGVTLRIPYPLETALARYENGIEKYKENTD